MMSIRYEILADAPDYKQELSRAQMLLMRGALHRIRQGHDLALVGMENRDFYTMGRGLERVCRAEEDIQNLLDRASGKTPLVG